MSKILEPIRNKVNKGFSETIRVSSMVGWVGAFEFEDQRVLSLNPSWREEPTPLTGKGLVTAELGHLKMCLTLCTLDMINGKKDALYHLST